MLRVVLGKELGGATLAVGVHAASVSAPYKTDAGHHFYFLPFLVKAEIFFGFLSVSKTGTNAGLVKIK